MRNALVCLLALGALLVPGARDGHCQPETRRLTAVTATSAPVFVLPDNTRTPLRMLPPGTRVRVLRDTGGNWLRIEFPDPRWGPRVGYIERKNIDMSGPDIEPPPPTARPGPSRPAPPPAPARRAGFHRVWIDANVGYARAGEEDYSAIAIRQINGQDARLQADYHLPPGIAFEIGGGVMATRQIGVGVTFSSTTQEDPAALSVEIPHPILPEPNATDTDTTDRSLERAESSLHIHGAFVSQTSDQLVLRLFGGPTYFRVQQDAVSNILYDQQFLPFDPLNQVDITGSEIQRISYDEATGWGFHAGLDISWFYTDALGVGFVGRYSKGTVGIRDPLTEVDADLDVGGFQAGAGVRVRF